MSNKNQITHAVESLDAKVQEEEIKSVIPQKRNNGTNYGSFSKDGKEFEINNVATPTPWINYIYNKEYFSTISNNAGGMSYLHNPLHGRITRYRINEVLSDRPGKYVYLKDNDTGEAWSLSWQPIGQNKDAYKVAHGFGYTRFEALYNDIESSMHCFVPLDDNQEIWKITLRNTSAKIKRLSVYGYVELCLGHGLIDLINQCDDQHFNRVYYDKDIGAIFGTKTYWVTESSGTQQQENQEWNQWAFFTTNLPVSSYETVRERFIGLHRNETNPRGLEYSHLESRDTDFGNTIAALHSEIVLQPGETTEFIYSLGVIPKEEFPHMKKTAPTRFHELSLVNQAIEAIKVEWEEFFSKTHVKTPEDNINTFMNYWTPYQAKVAFDVGRVASYYYWGIGRGFGFRDTAQDTIAVTISHPEKAKERVRLLSRQMFRDGQVFHHFHKDGQGEMTKHCDDPLWFILAVTDYIKETGDFEFLAEKQPFADNGEGSILEHMMGILKFVKRNKGKHGLPIFGRGDWNDTLDYIGGQDGGESVWGGMFYVAMLNRFIELLEFVNFKTELAKATEIRNDLIYSLEEYCWDGKWYIRAFKDDSTKIGSKENKYGKIFLNPQSWSVIANIGNERRMEKALDSVREHLNTDYGIKICAPAYKEIDKSIGLITRCVHGKKENGAIFGHPTTWLIQAECLLGRGDIAFEYYKKMLPNNIDSRIFKAEPYVYSQYITSDEHEDAGHASHSWQTGTAAWMYRTSIDYILGIRPDYSGLVIDPCIPSHWKKFEFKRMYRGIYYQFEVLNPKGVQTGIEEIYMDGRKIVGNYLPIINNSEVCKVTVLMG